MLRKIWKDETGYTKLSRLLFAKYFLNLVKESKIILRLEK